MLSNVLHHPTEPKYRSIRIANKHFYSRVGRFAAGLELLQCFGFEEACHAAAAAEASDTDAAAAAAAPAAAADAGAAPPQRATHLALPVADPARMAPGLVLLEAARQASVLVSDGGAASSDQQQLQQQPVGAPPPEHSTTGAAAAAAVAVAGANASSEGFSAAAASAKRPKLEATEESGLAATAAAAAATALAEEEGDDEDSFILPPDLEDYSAEGIDQYFGAVLAVDKQASATAAASLSLGEAALERLLATAEDASSTPPPQYCKLLLPCACSFNHEGP